MNKYMVIAWTFTTVLVSDIEFDGIDVVIGEYPAVDEEDAKKQAAVEKNISIDDLKAIQIL